MTETAKPKATSTAAWKKARVHEGVTLPSGAVVDINVPNLSQLIASGQLPNTLIDSAMKHDSAEDGKPLDPQVLMVGIGLVGLLIALPLEIVSVLLLPLVGLVFFRLYENQLVRQTESELIAQSAMLAAVYAREIEASEAWREEARERLSRVRSTPAMPESAAQRLETVGQLRLLDRNWLLRDGMASLARAPCGDRGPSDATRIGRAGEEWSRATGDTFFADAIAWLGSG